MAHNLESRNGVWSFAFTGPRSEIWHRLGNNLPADASPEQWITASGHDFEVAKVPALIALEGAQFDHIPAHLRCLPADNTNFIVRVDNGHKLGLCSDMYKLDDIQPRHVHQWFRDYITIDPRFAMSAAGTLGRGEKLWATAQFNGDLTIAGDAHKAYLLMSTAYDLTQQTINQMTVTRGICQNTVAVCHADTRAMIKTSHRTRFNGEKVAKELSQLAQSVATYKAVGDAMAQTQMAADQVVTFFKDLIDIPATAKKEEVSTRKMNQLGDLWKALDTTRKERGSYSERTASTDVWCALQAVTRYVDHDRSVRNADGNGGEIVARFASSQWGSGDAFKGKAMAMLLPRIKDKVPAMATV